MIMVTLIMICAGEKATCAYLVVLGTGQVGSINSSGNCTRKQVEHLSIQLYEYRTASSVGESPNSGLP
jgi:hypothetical protein